MLEELQKIYGSSWKVHLVDLESDEHKKEWFLRLNPNGRIPTLLDNRGILPISVMESPAILVYLQEHLDKDNIFGFDEPSERSQVLQWLFFWQCASPIQGTARYFYKSVEKPAQRIYAHLTRSKPGVTDIFLDITERFRSEMLRIYSVLEDHLSGKYQSAPRDYLAGSGCGKYSIADMGTWPHVQAYRSIGFSEEDMSPFGSLLRWINRVGQRDAVRIGTGGKYDSEENPDWVLHTV